MNLTDVLSSLTTVNLAVTALVLFTVYNLKPIVFKQFPNVPGPTPWPVFGNMLQSMKTGAGMWDLICIKKYGKVYRNFMGRVETLVVGDVDILKKVMVKEFTSFPNRGMTSLRGILSKSLFDSQDQDWTRLRHLLTPSFTSGKLKRMLPMVNECGEKLMANLEGKTKTKTDVDMKQLSGAFAMDTIASTAFGLNLDSQKDINNPFLINGLKLASFTFKDPLVIVIIFFPFLVPFLDKMGFVLGGTKEINFFRDFLQRTIEERQKQDKNPTDFLQLMLDAENEELDKEGAEDLAGVGPVGKDEMDRGLSSEEIMAQAIMFFIAAFDTTSTTIAFLAYNLSQNPEAQEKMYTEVVKVLEDYEEINYEALSKMTYMEQCLQETLRMYPPACRMGRIASQDISLNGLFIPKGAIVDIPIYALQNDPEIYPAPQIFKPERFASEGRNARNQFYHLPFGMGPRHCIGMRLALMEIKMAFAQMIQKYRFIPSEKKPKVEFGALTRALDGIWVKVEKR